MKKKVIKVISLALIFFVLLNVNSVFENAESRHFLQFGQKVYADYIINYYRAHTPYRATSAGEVTQSNIDVSYNKTAGIVNLNVLCYISSDGGTAPTRSYSGFASLYYKVGASIYRIDTVQVSNVFASPLPSNPFNYSISINDNLNIGSDAIPLYVYTYLTLSCGYNTSTYYESSDTLQPINNSPSISITSPSINGTFSSQPNKNIIPLSGAIYDPDIGNIETIFYRIDGTSGQSGTQYGNTITSNNTNQAFSGSIDVSNLNEGNHTLYVWVQDNYSGKSAETAIPFKVDKTPPIVNTPTLFADSSSQITITPNASDAIAGISGYLYNKDDTDLESWQPGNYQWGNLLPNTQYTFKYKAKDAADNISGYSSPASIYTKAEVPSLSANNPSSCSIDITDTSNNPNETLYQIQVNSGEKYVTQEGTLTAAPTWITLPTNRIITVTGLNPDTAYTFEAKAKNGDGIETAWSSSVSGTTLIQPPGSPSNITATATSSLITVVWDAVEGATGYDIEVDNTVIDTGAGTTYTHIGLNPSTEHKYRVRARNAGGAGSWSSYMYKSTLPSIPDAPTNLTATPGSTTVTVTWSSVPYATAYEVEVDGEVMNNGAGTSYIHSGLTSGTHHTYRVRAINAGGKSAWSTAANATTTYDSLDVPANLRAVPSRDRIVLTWDAVTDCNYDIEVDGIAINTDSRTTYTHTGLPGGTGHTYRVRAKKTGTASDWSSALTVSTLADTFGTPANLKAEASDTSVILAWDAVTGATGYEVEADGVVTGNELETVCIFNNLNPNSLHTYRVRAKSGDVSSDWSSPLNVTTYMLPTPSNLVAEPSETSIALSWEAVDGAAGYEVEVDGSIIENIQSNLYTAEGMAKNVQHTFRVRARSEEGTSAWSNYIKKSTIYDGYDIPDGIVTKSKSQSITLFWKPVTDATGYEVEADGAIIENIQDTKYVHSNLQPGTQHTYRVRSKQDGTASGWSNILAVSTLPILPYAPSNVALSATTTSIRVSWDVIDNVTSYEIEADGQLIDNGTGNTFLHSGLAPDTTHTYRVRAGNTSGVGEWSPIASTATKSSTDSYAVDCEAGETFNILVTGTNIDDPAKYTFTITYDTSRLEVIDLCGTTPGIDLGTGNITGTDIRVVQYVPGTIVLVKTGGGIPGQSWSGIVDNVKFRAKVSGQATIAYSIQ